MENNWFTEKEIYEEVYEKWGTLDNKEFDTWLLEKLTQNEDQYK